MIYAGNQTQQGSYTFAYDAENRLKSSTINNATMTYSYDGDERRVMKVSGGVTTVFVYDALGHLAAEYGAEPGPDIPLTHAEPRAAQKTSTHSAV